MEMFGNPDAIPNIVCWRHSVMDKTDLRAVILSEVIQSCYGLQGVELEELVPRLANALISDSCKRQDFFCH